MQLCINAIVYIYVCFFVYNLFSFLNIIEYKSKLHVTPKKTHNILLHFQEADANKTRHHSVKKIITKISPKTEDRLHRIPLRKANEHKNR